MHQLQPALLLAQFVHLEAQFVHLEAQLAQPQFGS